MIRKDTTTQHMASLTKSNRLRVHPTPVGWDIWTRKRVALYIDGGIPYIPAKAGHAVVLLYHQVGVAWGEARHG